MKKLTLLISTALLIGAGCTQSNQPVAEPNSLTVYTYDSLAADYGLLPQIESQFELDNQVSLNIVTFPDTGAMLNQLIVESDDPQADIVLGLDNINFVEAVAFDLLLPYRPQRADDLDTRLLFDEQFTMTPFDYGYLGFVYDSEAIEFAGPVSLKTLAEDPAYQDNIIITQAGLSSPGTQLMVWAQTALGDTDAATLADNLSQQVLTVAPDWNTAYYSMFLNGEAPIVLSYLTSPAYHIDQEGSNRYQAIPMADGYMQQVEGVAIVNGTTALPAAQAFVDYLLTDAVQNRIPTTQWMWPVLGDDSTWPEAYQQIITPQDDEILTVSSTDVANYYATWLQDWNQAFGIQ